MTEDEEAAEFLAQIIAKRKLKDREALGAVIDETEMAAPFLAEIRAGSGGRSRKQRRVVAHDLPDISPGDDWDYDPSDPDGEFAGVSCYWADDEFDDEN